MQVKNIYEENYVLTTNYYDASNHLSLQGTLDLLQNIAARHAYFLGAGKEALQTLNLFWVIARTEVNYVSYPKTPISVRVITWPTKATRFYFDRMYKIIDNTSGKLILTARSRWVLVDASSRRIAGTNRYDYPLEIFHDEVLFTADFRRIIPSEEKVGEYIVRPSDIDENNHLNNSKYGSIIYDFLRLNNNQVIKNVVISYANEALVDETLTIYMTKIDDIITINGHKNDTITFSSEVEISKWAS